MKPGMISTDKPKMGRLASQRRSPGFLLATILIAATAASAGALAADPAAKRWTEDELVAGYRELASTHKLEDAVRTPAPPKDPPQANFLDALAWYAAGMPNTPGVLTLKQLDRQLGLDVESYIGLLKSKVEHAEDNDYARTRTWKLVQKLTMLREEIFKPARNGRYSFPAMRKASGDPEADAWDREHTLKSPEEFAEKVCRASNVRPVLVKFGNTNCTQCMLFEIIGSVKEFAEDKAHKGVIDVYKVWWGYKPDEGFSGRVRDPERLDLLVKAEGVRSSPAFIVYRNGRRYPCGDGFPNESHPDERLEACVRQDFGDAPVAAICGPGGATAPATGGR